MYKYIVTVMVFELPPFIIFSPSIGSASPHGSRYVPTLQAKRRMEEERMGKLEKYREDYEVPLRQDGARWRKMAQDGR